MEYLPDKDALERMSSYEFADFQRAYGDDVIERIYKGELVPTPASKAEHEQAVLEQFAQHANAQAAFEKDCVQQGTISDERLLQAGFTQSDGTETNETMAAAMQEFKKRHSEYKRSDFNAELLVGFLVRNDLGITADNLSLAFQVLSQYQCFEQPSITEQIAPSLPSRNEELGAVLGALGLELRAKGQDKEKKRKPIAVYKGWNYFTEQDILEDNSLSADEMKRLLISIGARHMMRSLPGPNGTQQTSDPEFYRQGYGREGFPRFGQPSFDHYKENRQEEK